MRTRWINKFLGTAPAVVGCMEPDVLVLDVRDLVDKAGNNHVFVQEKIDTGVKALKAGKRLVVCCDYGVSRSNAIAAGILARFKGSSVDDAAREIIAATGEAEIKLELLNVVRLVVHGTNSQSGRQSLDSDRILVTGGNGFVGKAVVEQLKNVVPVLLAPSRSELDLLEGRLQLDMLIRGEGITRVIHLANPTVYTSNLALGNTLAMLRNVLETCVANKVPILYLSSWEVYSGYRTGYLSADESLPILPSGPFGDTKFLCESLINHFRRTSDLECALLRSSPAYGGRGERPKFIHTFIEKARRGEHITTHQYANGSPSLDLLHINDLADAICKAMTARFNGDLNIGTGKLTTTRQLAEWIVAWINSDSLVDSIALEKDMACIAMDHTRATRSIGWQPTIPIEEGLRELVEKMFNQSIEQGVL